MSKTNLQQLMEGELIDEQQQLTLSQLCQRSRLPAERVFELVAEGILEPSGNEPVQWRFYAIALQRIHCVQRLEHDLGVNTAGAALALELLDELQQLRQQLERLES